jgi:predicted Zn-dependent peptidase
VPTQEVQAAEVRAVTASDVQRVARQYLDPARMSVVITRPPGEDDQPDDEEGP